jgi:hypothetical protein
MIETTMPSQNVQHCPENHFISIRPPQSLRKRCLDYVIFSKSQSSDSFEYKGTYFSKKANA